MNTSEQIKEMIEEMTEDSLTMKIKELEKGDTFQNKYGIWKVVKPYAIKGKRHKGAECECLEHFVNDSMVGMVASGFKAETEVQELCHQVALELGL